MPLPRKSDLLSKGDLDHLAMLMMRRQAERYRWLRLVGGPLLAMLLLATLLGDHVPWRKWMLGAMVGLLMLRAAAEALLLHRRRADIPVMRRVRPPAVAAALPAVGAGIFIFATGGFDSPMMPMVLPIAFFVGTLTEPRMLGTLVLSSVALVIGLAAVSLGGWVPDLLPAVFGGGARAPEPASLVSARAAALVFMLGWGATGSSLVRRVFRQIAGDALDARDQVLANHEDHIRELTALSGEIAHELKNPLANVKGLAVLVGRDVEGRAAERVGVLLHEVDRMEGILQEFLTFSRPLLPLNEEGVDLDALCRSVAALHEGLAHAKNVAIVVQQEGPVRARGDARKLKQVLINLVQNALDASPRGATIELVLMPAADGGARVEVRDRGGGLSVAVKANLFEPGVTTKERGSGLGLALARGLARQHGGELVLEDREDGGCVAALMLPATQSPPTRSMA